jgi:hypothetical protein
MLTSKQKVKNFTDLLLAYKKLLNKVSGDKPYLISVGSCEEYGIL